MTDYVATLRAIGRPATRFDVREHMVRERLSAGIGRAPFSMDVLQRVASSQVPTPAAVGAALDKLVTDGTVTREDRGNGVVLYSVKS